jgi:RNA polymerase sigma factor (sigma-70 family)
MNEATPPTLLMERAARGDTTAWTEIVGRYAPVVRAVVATTSGLCPADKADAVQNTWLRLLERAETIRDPEKIVGWLATTARREGLAIALRRRSETTLSAADEDPPSPDPSPEAQAIDAETRLLVRRATDELPDRSRALLEALYFDPARPPYALAARQLEMPIGSIGPTRARVLRILRATLACHGVTTEHSAG